MIVFAAICASIIIVGTGAALLHDAIFGPPR